MIWMYVLPTWEMRTSKRLQASVTTSFAAGIWWKEGRAAIIVRALYSGKSAGRDYWLHLRLCMQFLGFFTCKADPNRWMRAAKRKDNLDYYKYVLLYVDNCLAIGVDPESILRHEIGKYFQLKEESIGEPTIYLRATCLKVEVNGVCCWAFSLSRYMKAACKNVKINK